MVGVHRETVAGHVAGDDSKPAKVDRRMPVIPADAPQPVLKLLGKPTKAVDHDENVRARSAIMRVAEKL